MEPEITSVRNPRIKAVRALREAKERRDSGLFCIEGNKLLAEAMATSWPVVDVFATPAWLQQHPAANLGGKVPITVSSEVMAAMGTLENPEGVLAIGRIPVTQPHLEIQEDTLVVVADGIQDPGNLGTFIRTADAAGAQAVILGPGTADPFNPKVVRASMGSLFHLALIRASDLQGFRHDHPGLSWIATTPVGGVDLFEARLTGPLAWWVGNEAAGLPPESIATADQRVYIPMPGRAESLNAGAALAICLFETVRQRRTARRP